MISESEEERRRRIQRARDPVSRSMLSRSGSHRTNHLSDEDFAYRYFSMRVDIFIIGLSIAVAIVALLLLGILSVWVIGAVVAFDVIYFWILWRGRKRRRARYK